MSHLVMLKGNWPAETFRRCVRDKAGEVVEALEFRRGVPVELTATQFAAVEADLGISLAEVTTDGKNRPRPKDWTPPAAAASGTAGGDSSPAADSGSAAGAKSNRKGGGKSNRKGGRRKS